jgi:transcriptional regulator with XRE-family HTH domain
MNTDFPSAERLRERLKGLRLAQVDALASASGVPSSTLMKIRNGVTPNPGIETVRKFFHLLPPTDTESQANAERVA